MEKVEINQDVCIGCGLCVQKNPEYIAFNDEGHAEPLDREIRPEDKNNILESVEECPTEAIRIVEEK